MSTLQRCAEGNCTNPVSSRGLCKVHYARHRYLGDLDKFDLKICLSKDPNNRFDRYTDKISSTSGCWLWTGYLDKDGYGKIIYSNKRTAKAHRFSYTRYIGKIPAGMLVCHTCDIRNCVNPEHLFIGTSRDNTQDMVSKGRGIFGARHASTHFTEEDVLNIRYMYSSGDCTQKNIAKLYEVTTASIWSIVHRKSWKHI